MGERIGCRAAPQGPALLPLLGLRILRASFLHTCISGTPCPKEAQPTFRWQSCGGHPGPLPPAVQTCAALHSLTQVPVAQQVAPTALTIPHGVPHVGPFISLTSPTQSPQGRAMARGTAVLCSPNPSPAPPCALSTACAASHGLSHRSPFPRDSPTPVSYMVSPTVFPRDLT